MRRHATIPILALSLLSACYAGADGDAHDDGGTDDGGSDDGADGGGDGATDGGEPGARCESSQLGPRLLRRLTRDELEHSLRDIFPELGDAWAGVRLGPDPLSKLGFSNDAAMLQVGDQTAADLLDTAVEVAALVTAPERLPTILPCAGTTADAACVETFLDTYGRRLFRRALTADERADYLALFTDNAAEADFPAALQWMLVALIQSPHALYRRELGTDDADGFALDADELATALAYDFSGTTPSEALLDAAAAGELDDPEARVQWARTLLDSPAGRALVQRFAAEWTGFERVGTATKNDVPEFDTVRAAMMAETRALFDAVWFEDEGDVRALLTAPSTIVDAELAAFYGWPAPGADGRVDRPAGWGVGLLAQGSLLASNAHADASSPTKRGLLVYRRLLCQDVPPPPPGIPPIDAVPTGETTTRQRYEEVHAASESCRGCHDQFDPIGFGLEHFDAVGRWRADERGLPIDATGTLVVGDAEPIAFDGLDALATSLAEGPEVTDCASGLAATWVFGGAGGQSCLAEDARTALVDGEIGMIEYVASLAGAPHFARRR